MADKLRGLQMVKKRIVDMTDEEKKAYRTKYKLEYDKTEKGRAAIARRDAKFAKKLSPLQIRVLKTLKEGGNLRVWYQDFHPFGKHCELRGRNNRVLKSSMSMLTVESLQSEEKQGMLLEIKSEKEDEIIYVISKKGLQALEKE